jgi:putative hydrolase of the HAD superfamily
MITLFRNWIIEQQSLKLERIGIKDYFNCIITAGDVGGAKPDIRLFEIACRRVNESHKDCFYIGDDLNTDILPCKEVYELGVNILSCINAS